MASGFALRRNSSCLATETACGPTAPPYWACCPLGSFCPHQYNMNCCPTAANCTLDLLPDPQCANAEWNLFDNNGYFCCLPGLAGYARPGNSDGCAEAGFIFGEGEQLLRTISTGKATSTITSSRRSTTSSSQGPPNSSISVIPSSSSPTAPVAPGTNVTIVESVGASSPQTTSSSASIASTAPTTAPTAAPKTGTIVGAVVGAILAVALITLAAWFLLDWRRRRRQLEDDPLTGTRIAEADHANAIHEKDARGYVSELPTNVAHEKDSRPIFELEAAEIPEMPA